MRVSLTSLLLIAALLSRLGQAQALPSSPSSCQIQPVDFEGWKAQEISNRWVRLTIVPQLGGRLMQISFAGHSYLFVNPRYRGQYIPPSEAKGRWINYGGDKIWPLPEGTDDEQHWALSSDALDDGEYSFKILSQNPRCSVQLEGPPDPRTGLQYLRVISLENDSPEIRFHAVMRNTSGHSIQWSVQSVSQYDLAKPDSSDYNHDFWAFTPVNPRSAYVGSFYVRSGLADDPSFRVRDRLFSLHWLYLDNEVWLDSDGGWVAIVDGSSQYAMVERFHYQAAAEYPGHATVILYKNGPGIRMDDKGMPSLSASSPDQTPYYMEAELNSPLVRLEPGQTYAMDTEWLPTRCATDLQDVTDAGVVRKPLAVTSAANGLTVSGSFGVFFPGRLIARLYNARGREVGEESLGAADPANAVDLHQTIPSDPAAARISLHLVDRAGVDRGSLGEAVIPGADGDKH